MKVSVARVVAAVSLLGSAAVAVVGPGVAAAAGQPAGASMQGSATVVAGGHVAVNGTGCVDGSASTIVLVTIQAPGGATLVSKAVLTQGPPVGPVDGSWGIDLPMPTSALPSPYYQLSASCRATGELFTYTPLALKVTAGSSSLLAVTPLDAGPGSTLTVSAGGCKPVQATPTSVAVVLTDPYGNDVDATAVTPPKTGVWTDQLTVPTGAPLGIYQVSATCDGYVTGFAYSATDVAVASPPGAAPTSLSWVGPVTGPANSTVALSARLTSGGLPIAGQTVTLAVPGSSSTGVTGANGVVQALVTLPSSGSPSATATFSGDPGFAASTTLQSLTLTAGLAKTSLKLSVPTAPIAFEPTTLSATLSANGSVPAGRPVTFLVQGPSGTTSMAALTNSSGVATLPYTFTSSGPGSVRAVFPAATDTSYAASTSGTTAVSVGSAFQPTAVACGSATACVVVDAGGRAKVTGDAGAHWSFATVPSSAGLTSVSCPTVTRCVAVGKVGMILTSSDGGKTWQSAPSPTANDLTEVRCPSAAACTALGTAGTTLQSANGGGAWTLGSSPEPGMDFDALACTSSTSCLAAAYSPATFAGATLQTADGGLSWVIRSSFNPAAGTSSQSSLTCLGASTCLASAFVPYITTDAGVTWTQAATTVFGSTGAVVCPTATTCIDWGGYTSQLSSDGGHTWVAGPDFGDGTLFVDLACRGKLCVGVQQTYGYSQANASISTNNGQQWSSVGL